MSTYEGSQHESQETFPYPFDWKSYMNSPDAVPSEIVAKLDELVAFVNDPDESEFDDFRNNFRLYRKPLLTLITYCRPYLSVQERVAINAAVEQANT